MDLKQKIDSYQTSEHNQQLVKDTNLVLVAGIVSAGKDTTVNELLKNSAYEPIISHTTRMPRHNHGVLEENGKDYYFIDLETAERMIDNAEFIEAKYVHGNVYGTSAAELARIHRQEKFAVTDIDIHGVEEYLRIRPDTKAIFLLPPSVKTWLERLEKRYGKLDMNSEDIRTRMVTAAHEIEHVRSDGRFVIVINDDLATTLERIHKVIDGEKSDTSDYADAITEHILEYISTVV